MKLRLFIRFLKAYGLYEEYLGELSCFQGINCTNLFFCDRLKQVKPTRYLVESISWSRTSRGFHFWSMVNDAWLDYFSCHVFED